MSAFLDLLLESSVRALAVALLVAAVLRASRSHNSSLRHAAWTFALAAMLLMPVLLRIAPALPALPSLVIPVSLTGVGAGFQSGEPIQAPRAGVAAGPQSGGSVFDAGQSGGTAPGAIDESVAESAGTSHRSMSVVQIVFAIWAVGAMVQLTRLMIGAWMSIRLGRRAERLPFGSGTCVYASPAARVPLTVGFFRPRIVLPAEWPSWPPERLAAVLAHETAHVRRRDSLVLLLAACNQCVFWFHPLAWWLTRKLATTAEDLCDEAGALAIGNTRRYAEILLAIAGEGRRGGRVAWTAVGIHGTGGIQRRIDRLLTDEISRPVSRARIAAVLTVCSAALLLVVSCRQRVEAVALTPDPEVAARLAGQKAMEDRRQKASKMTEAEVDALEATVRANPEDLDARGKLLIFYQSSGQKVLGWDRKVAARRPHLLWLIEHRPEDDLSMLERLSPQLDAAGYALGQALWLARTAKPDASANILGNAAYFFENTDKASSEKFLLRAKAIDPDGPQPRIDQHNMYRLPWISRLGRLYAGAILGATVEELTAGVQGSFATHARKVLDESNDPALLLSAGSQIVRLVSSPRKFDFRALGRTYLERATRLQPGGEAGRLLASLDEGERSVASRKEWNAKVAEVAGGDIARKFREGVVLTREEWQTLEDVEPKAVAALPEADRFERLPGLASNWYNRAETIDYGERNSPRAKALWDRSKQYAREALALAPKFQSDPGYANALYSANVVLSINALREGDVKTSVTYMKAAANVPALSSPRRFGIEGKLVNYLLKVGERESVASFLERSAAINAAEKDQFLKDAADIRAGRMPVSYQYMVTPH